MSTLNSTNQPVTQFPLALSLFCIYLSKVVPKHTQKTGLNADALTIYTHYGSTARILGILRSHSLCRFRVLTDLVVIDRPTHQTRFHLKYLLTSQLYNTRAVLTTFVDSIIPAVSSLSVFQNAN
jgi:NADH:ubiquinone oxidoreductase subunit C